mgnify:CR=1 FL=1
MVIMMKKRKISLIRSSQWNNLKVSTLSVGSIKTRLKTSPNCLVMERAIFLYSGIHWFAIHLIQKTAAAKRFFRKKDLIPSMAQDTVYGRFWARVSRIVWNLTTNCWLRSSWTAMTTCRIIMNSFWPSFQRVRHWRKKRAMIMDTGTPITCVSLKGERKRGL